MDDLGAARLYALDMSAKVILADTSGQRWELVPGDVLGRSRAAALRLNDPRISEAHALVSLRGSSLRLLALRGRFAVRGQVVTEVELTTGLELEFASDLGLRVERVILPDEVLALELPSGERLVPPKVASILPEPEGVSVVAGALPSAIAVIWTDEEALHVRRPGLPDESLGPLDTFTVGAWSLRVRSVALSRSAIDTTVAGNPLERPLSFALVPEDEAVHVTVGGDLAGAIEGVPARLLIELTRHPGTSEWRALAGALWPHEDDARGLRQKWDAGLARLRRRLAELCGRRDLVRTDGAGRFELALGPRDAVQGRA